MNDADNFKAEDGLIAKYVRKRDETKDKRAIFAVRAGVHDLLNWCKVTNLKPSEVDVKPVERIALSAEQIHTSSSPATMTSTHAVANAASRLNAPSASWTLMETDCSGLLSSWGGRLRSKFPSELQQFTTLQLFADRFPLDDSFVVLDNSGVHVTMTGNSTRPITKPTRSEA